MKMYKSIAFLTIFLVVGLFQAFAGNQQDLPLPHKVAGQHVYLWSSKYELLKPDEVASLEWQLAVFEKKTGVDIDVFVCAAEGREIGQINSIVNELCEKSFSPMIGTKRVLFFFILAEKGNVDPFWVYFADKDVLNVDSKQVSDGSKKRIDALPKAKSKAIVYRVFAPLNSWADVWLSQQHKGLVSN